MEEKGHQETSDEFEWSADDTAKQAGTSWVDVAWLMISDIVGTSVLCFVGVAVEVGSGVASALIVSLFPMSVYVSVCMARTRALVVKLANVREESQANTATMGEVAGALMRCKWAGDIVIVVVYGYTLLGQGSYLLTLGNSLQELLYTSGMCIYTAVAWGCLVLAVPVILVRRLGESVAICFGNLLLIVAVLAVSFYDISVNANRSSCVDSPLVAPGLTILMVMGAATRVVYSYAGQWMYFEMMETMAKPSDFPKAFVVTGPFMVITYLIVALVGYHLGVRSSQLLDGMPEGIPMRVASFLLFLHVLVVYLIKSVVLQQYVHRVIAPNDVDARSAVSYLKHGGLGVGMLAFCFLVANSVPFFSQLIGLIGGLLAGPINFIFPLVLYLIANGRLSLAGEASCSDSSDTDGAAIEDRASAAMQASSLSAAMRGLRLVPRWEALVIALISAFTLLTMFLGVADVLEDIVRLNGDYGAPFSCHAYRGIEKAAAANSTLCPA